MKTLMITAPSSNTGKTTVTLGLIRALRNRNIDVSAFKTGPDYIDSKYLGQAAKKTAGNLDMHLMGEDGLRKSLDLNPGDFAVIEGAMGYFDGIYNGYENSSYHMSQVLDVPAILVYQPKGEMFSAIPKIKGMAEFQDSRIRGVILNKTSKMMYMLLKEQIEKYTDLEVLGYLPKDESLNIESRSLGLSDGYDDARKEEIIQATAELLEETLDIDRILEMARDIGLEEFKYPRRKNISVAIARDQAFGFHYRENLKILQALAEVKFFSPLRDKNLPEADLVILGGGYPELYLEELSSNQELREDIRNYVEGGGYLIAEGGGLMYLSRSIDSYPMLGLIEGDSFTDDRLDRFGYVNIHLEEDCLYGRKGDIIPANEYHKSHLETDLDRVFTLKKLRGTRSWTCGYKYKNALAYYQHINYLGNMDRIDRLLNIIEEDRGV